MAEIDPRELFTDALLRRQIVLQGYSNSLSRDIIALLNATEADLVAAIRSRLRTIAGQGGIDLGPATTARLKLLQAAIAKLRDDGFTKAADMWNEQLESLVTSEATFARDAINRVQNAQGEAVTFDALLPTAVSLATVVSVTPFEGALMRDWADKVQADDLQRIMQQITIGLTRGETLDQIVRRIIGSGPLHGTDGILATTRRNVEAITRTAVNTFSNKARRLFFDANTDIFDEEVFVATLDSHTTAICQATDGTVSPVGEGPQPPLHWGCRSIVVALIGDKLAGMRPAQGDETKRVPATTTYQIFLSRQSPAFQDEVLGPTRGKLFREGGLDLKSFVAKDGHQYTIDELREREPEAFQRVG